jgi:uncharacterized protein YaeQ
MALTATIIKAELQVADMDRHYYQSHSLTLAQHPSETEERLMLRVLVFGLHASESLAFTKGLSSEDEPDIWQKNLTDEIDLWIELGQPSEKRLRKACGRARQVLVYTYGRNTVEPWWKQIQPQLSRFDNLSVFYIPPTITKALALSASRNMSVQVNVQEKEISWLCKEECVTFTPDVLYPKVE